MSFDRISSAHLGTLWLILMVCASVASGAESDDALDREALVIPAPLGLDWCLARARSSNPGLARAIAYADAARYRIDSSGTLEDPRFAYEASNIPTGDFDFGSTPLSGHQFGLRQKLPVPGLLANRRTAARSGATSSRLLVDDEQVWVEGKVEAAWAELGFAQQARNITNRNIKLLRQLAETAEARYRVGNGLQQDVLRSQVELTALLQERLRRDEAISLAEADLIAILDLPIETVIPPIADLELISELPALGPLLSTLDESSARLHAARSKIDEAKSQVRVAELEGYPDFDFGVGYRVRKRVAGDPVSGDDFVSAGLTLRLPINRSKWRGRVAEKRALVRRAEATLRVDRSMLESTTRRAHAELVRASAEEALMETGLVPQARQSLASSRSGYEVGRIDFLSLLDSQVRLLDAELRLARARADKRRAFAMLESAAGEKLR
ncbi:MAG: TolC family protein [Myxococcales bacterium]|nr:TolC family protein [Myxococcales bacterium]HIK86616.1 TolC family protein [Myxococcales bacterium]